MELCCKHGISNTTLYEWRGKYGGMDISVGRPFGRDFQRQNSRNPFLCHRTSVSGLTTIRACFQSNSLARVAIVTRVALSVRRGACLRSTKNVSCFRRKRFSAARALQTAFERTHSVSTHRFACVGAASRQSSFWATPQTRLTAPSCAISPTPSPGSTGSKQARPMRRLPPKTPSQPQLDNTVAGVDAPAFVERVK